MMRRDERKIALRCAVYTRVSGRTRCLEQDFNSLDNQREASEAYIKSEAHRGRLVRERYDDGGFSGGSMQEPALQKLLDDVLARKIDVIVVYKVDRLTRSLADFAKPVELFAWLRFGIGRSDEPDCGAQQDAFAVRVGDKGGADVGGCGGANSLALIG